MAALTFLWWLAVAFLGAQLFTLLGNLLFFPVLRSSRKAATERVSLLVPARNEAATLPETLPRLLGQEALEVVVLDDASTDATPAILGEFSAHHPNLRVLRGEPLPEGWTGKNWACQQLSCSARGDILVFTDADVRWEAGTLNALLAFREREGADFVSIWPRQVTGSLLERLVVPVIDQFLLAGLPYLGVRFLPFGAFSAGNGQLMLWTRRAYERVGAHAAFKNEVLEDVRMGQAAKGAGLRVALALGRRIIATRMYRSPQALLEGFSKNIAAAAGGRVPLLILTAVSVLSHTLVWPLALLDARWLVPAALSLSLRLLVNLKTGRSPLETPLQPLMSFPLLVIAGRAIFSRGYRWKGRTYP